MTQEKRIVFNTVATYGRSMFGVFCGIFSTRWVLAALGHEDFGLYAVVGSMTIFLGFLNIQFGGAIARYYAYAVGQAKTLGGQTGIRECQSWFTTAVMIHTVLPLIIVSIGWPIGEQAILRQWLNIPLHRIDACLWVWRIVCISTFLGMFTVPFQAMYTAKQYIAELTVYSFLQTIARTAFIYYMTLNPGDWLVRYAIGLTIIAHIPQTIITYRAVLIFKECRIVKSAFREFNRVKDLASYALWTAIGGLGYVASHQCMSILINNFYGARVVAGFGIAQTVSSEAASLTGSLQAAFAPAVTTAYGAKEFERFRLMAFWACKAGTFLTLMFAIPMALEIDQLLLLWLKDPPPMAASMSICALAFIVIEKFSCGHLTAVNATGRIAKFQIVRGILRCLVLPLAIVPAYFNWGVVAATAALPVSVIFVDLGDVLLARNRAGLSIGYWMRNVVAPLGAIAVVGSVSGCWAMGVMKTSILRMAITTGCSLVAMVVSAWILLLTDEERVLMKAKYHGLFKRVCR